MGTPPLIDLLFVDLPQLRDICGIPSNRPLDDFCTTGQTPTLWQSVRRRHGLEFDDTNAWIILTTVMFAVTLVSNPSLQGGGVVFLNGLTVGDDGGGAGDGGPATGGGD